jgi:hypothetical protein
MFIFFVIIKYSQQSVASVVSAESSATIALLDQGGVLKSLGYCTDENFEEDIPLSANQEVYDPFQGRLKSIDDPSAAMGVTVSMYCERFIEDATTAVLNGDIQVAILIPRDYRSTGKLTVYSADHKEPLVSHAMTVVSTMLRQAIAEPISFDPITRARMTDDPEYVVLNPWGERFLQKPKVSPRPEGNELDPIVESESKVSEGTAGMSRKSARQLATFWGLMVISLAGTAGFSCTRSERISHLIEIILSSVASEEYILGRVVSTSCITALQACLQVLTYAAAEYCVMPSVETTAPAAGSVPTAILIPVIVVVALFGSIFTNLLGLTLGVIGKPSADDKISAFIALVTTYFFGGIIIVLVSAPKSALAKVLTYIPLFTAPAIIIRTTAGRISPLEGVIALMFLMYFISKALSLAARTMNACLSLDGQPLSISAIREAFSRAP